MSEHQPRPDPRSDTLVDGEGDERRNERKPDESRAWR
jgi:hypothetical protein